MNKRFILILGLLWACAAEGSTSQAYLQRFQNYQQWREELPAVANQPFENFIMEDKPLSNQLRNAWLFDLAEKKQWSQYLKYYKATSNTALLCNQAWAYFQTNQKEKALTLLKPLWLVGHSQNKACDSFFAALLKENLLSNALIEQRVIQALRVRNIPLARYLLGQLKPPHNEERRLLLDIYRHPEHINQLKTGTLHSEFYLYGLKRMVARNMDTAVRYWRHVNSQTLLNDEQQQAFLAHVALYKAMRNKKDAYRWFKKVKPQYYNNALVEWQLRYALKNKQWRQVAQLSNLLPDQDDPGLIYWRARASEKTGQAKRATAQYQKLAKMRHYYGFLASVRLKQPFQFEEERPTKDQQLLHTYQPILDKIQTLYENKHYTAASRSINDFASELPKNEQSAFALWIADALHWYGKSVYLANDEVLHDQLDLRFPLAHRNIITAGIKGKPLPNAFIFAIIRQESAFRSQVVSRVGARGLMQIMPDTAAMVARNHRISYKNSSELFDATKNINLGIAYLNQLHKRFNGHPALMAAAYNAGPHQVARWLKDNPSIETDIWVETIPFHETRNYLKNVMAFYAVYQHRLEQSPKLQYFLKPIKP